MSSTLVDIVNYGTDVNWLVERNPVDTSNRVVYDKLVGIDLLYSVSYAVEAESMTFSFCLPQYEKCTHKI